MIATGQSKWNTEIPLIFALLVRVDMQWIMRTLPRICTKPCKTTWRTQKSMQYGWLKKNLQRDIEGSQILPVFFRRAGESHILMAPETRYVFFPEWVIIPEVSENFKGIDSFNPILILGTILDSYLHDGTEVGKVPHYINYIDICWWFSKHLKNWKTRQIVASVIPWIIN